MRRLILLYILCFMFSCKEEETKINIFKAKINGIEYISETGDASRYIDLYNGEYLRYYYLFLSNRPSIKIEAYDSSFIRLSYTYPDFQASYVVGVGNIKQYHAINGQFTISEINNGTIVGYFSFDAVSQSDNSDTICIREGYFEYTLSEYERNIGELTKLSV